MNDFVKTYKCKKNLETFKTCERDDFYPIFSCVRHFAADKNNEQIRLANRNLIFCFVEITEEGRCASLSDSICWIYMFPWQCLDP